MPRAFTDGERAAIRASLMRTARQSAARLGFRRTSVADLARGVGISKGAFYQFFQTKEDVFVAVMHEAEAELRSTIDAIVADTERDGTERLRDVLHTVFTVAHDHPMLALLSDPEEFAWLMRAVPPEQLAAARADDDRYFAEVAVALKRQGVLADDVDVDVFAGLPPAALAVAQQRALIGDDRFARVTAMVVDGLVLRLGA